MCCNAGATFFLNTNPITTPNPKDTAVPRHRFLGAGALEKAGKNPICLIYFGDNAYLDEQKVECPVFNGGIWK